MPITSASERRAQRERGIEVQFPEYGDWVAVRPMDPAFFFQQGMIPDFLAPTVNEMIGTGKTVLPTPEKNAEWLAWLDSLVKFAFVNPKVVDDPQGDNEISIEEVGYTDKIFLYSLFGRPAHILRAFRTKQIELVAGLDASKTNGHLAEPIPENNGVGQ